MTLPGEERSVVVVPDLGEMARCGRRGAEAESVKSGTRRRGDGDFDRRGVFQEVPGELICSIAELKRLCDPAPLDMQGVDDSGHKRNGLREAVGNREDVVEWNVRGLEHGCALSEMNIDAFLRNRNRPEECIGGDAGIVGMRTQG